MRLRTLTAALVTAGLSGGAVAEVAGPVDPQLGVTGDQPGLSLVEKGAYALIESALSTVAGVLQVTSCGDVGDYPQSRNVEVTVFDESGNIKSADTGTEATIDGVTFHVTDQKDNFRGTLLQIEQYRNSGSDRIFNVLVEAFKTRPVPTFNPAGTEPGFGFDEEGSMAYASADMKIDGDQYDEHIIKDFWKRCTGPDTEVKPCRTAESLPPDYDRTIVDFGLELITKMNYPRSKYEQGSLYKRPNGGLGSLWIYKTKIAPNFGTLCQIQLHLVVDDQSPTSWHGKGKVLTMAVADDD